MAIDVWLVITLSSVIAGGWAGLLHLRMRLERDAARAERDAARAERDAARAERDAARAELDGVRHLPCDVLDVWVRLQHGEKWRSIQESLSIGETTLRRRVTKLRDLGLVSRDDEEE